MSFDTDIRTALRSVLMAVPGLPASIEWENKRFDPQTGTPFLRETMIPLTEVPYAFGEPSVIMVTGEAQYDLFYPLDDGTANLENLAYAIKTAFKPGLKINSLVYVAKSMSMPAQPSDQYFMKPVRVTWWAYRDAN